MFTRQLEKLRAFQKSIIPVQINILRSYYDKQAGVSLKSLIFKFFICSESAAYVTQPDFDPAGIPASRRHSGCRSYVS